ncbi:hypothetical protein ABIC89_002432 [Variovorax boronicumulans]|uniref:hypothetical protein n=1 Tax=Variovorax boronicumulans TaxID=436515 RepID=UPI0033931A0D
MGYDLRLCIAADEQLDYLRQNTQHTSDFINSQVQDASPAVCTELYSKGGLYFVLNGTAANVDGVTNFPNVGGRYRGEMLGLAVELGEVGVGHAHGFRAAQVSELRRALADLDAVKIERRSHTYAAEMGQDGKETARDALADIEALREFLDSACTKSFGMIWFWA